MTQTIEVNKYYLGTEFTTVLFIGSSLTLSDDFLVDRISIIFLATFYTPDI